MVLLRILQRESRYSIKMVLSGDNSKVMESLVRLERRLVGHSGELFISLAELSPNEYC